MAQTMQIELMATVTVERVQGLFVSKDEIVEELAEMAENALNDSIYVGESEYEVIDSEVTAVQHDK